MPILLLPSIPRRLCLAPFGQKVVILARQLIVRRDARAILIGIAIVQV
jgi:hypothetical protein